MKEKHERLRSVRKMIIWFTELWTGNGTKEPIFVVLVLRQSFRSGKKQIETLSVIIIIDIFVQYNNGKWLTAKP